MASNQAAEAALRVVENWLCLRARSNWSKVRNVVGELAKARKVLLQSREWELPRGNKLALADAKRLSEIGDIWERVSELQESLPEDMDTDDEEDEEMPSRINRLIARAHALRGELVLWRGCGY